MCDFDPVTLNRCPDCIENALKTRSAKACYVPGDQIAGDQLRTFNDQPILAPPVVCQLCDAGFVSESQFQQHLLHDHGGENEYRKRVLYLMMEAGHRPISAQENG